MKQFRSNLRAFNGRHSTLFLQLPFVVLFTLFVVVPVLVAIGLSFTDFNSIQTPNFVGLRNYITILTDDSVFSANALPNTIRFAVIVGIGGYILSFLLAWSLAQVPRVPRTIMAIILYLPSMTSGIMLSTVWQVVFAGDKVGYLNALLLRLEWIQKPILWLSDAQYIMPIMILVSLWSCMGIGFLAMLAGILNVNKDLYEAAYIDGVHNRFQEIIYVTIPATRPYMMFGAVMSIVGAFSGKFHRCAAHRREPDPRLCGPAFGHPCRGARIRAVRNGLRRGGIRARFTAGLGYFAAGQAPLFG